MMPNTQKPPVVRVVLPKITGRLYCAIALGATVIAALREKVNAINELHIEGQRQKNIRIEHLCS